MMQTITTQETYKFSDLSEEAQDAAIEQQRIYSGEDFSDFHARDIIYDVKEAGKILGIDIDDIYYSGFWSQGDGACFVGSYSYAKGSAKAIREYAPEDNELHSIADNLVSLQRRYFYCLSANVTHSGHYYHEYCTRITVEDERRYYGECADDAEEEISEILRDFMRWIYRRLEAAYEYVTSEEAAREYLTDCELEFYADGSIA